MKSKIFIALFAVAVAVSFAFIGISKSQKTAEKAQPVQQEPMSGFALEDNQF